MSPEPGPARASPSSEGDVIQLYTDRHVQYIQSLDTVCAGALHDQSGAYLLDRDEATSSTG